MVVAGGASPVMGVMVVVARPACCREVLGCVLAAGEVLGCVVLTCVLDKVLLGARVLG